MDRVLKYIPINWSLISNPFNWAIIVLMIAIGGMALGLIFHPANQNYAGDDGT